MNVIRESYGRADGETGLTVLPEFHHARSRITEGYRMHNPGNALLEAFLFTADEGVVVQDAEGRITFTNPAAQRMLGLHADEVIGRSSSDLEGATIREDGSAFPASEHPAMVTLRTGAPSVGVVMGIQHDPGDPRTWIKITSAKIPDPLNNDAKVFTHFSDVTSYVESERRLRDVSERLEHSNAALAETEARLRAVLHTIPDMVWAKDLAGVYLDCNPEFERFFGGTAAEIVGKTDYDFVSKQQADSFRENDAAALSADGPCMNEEFVTYASDGHGALLETIKTPMRRAAGDVIGILGIARNITARRDVENQLRQAVANLEILKNEFQELSRTDALTGLANRRAFDEAMKAEFVRSRRFCTPTALLMIDIDHFKPVNDAYGHDAGDRALTALAAILKTLARATDFPARSGGEEFFVLLAGTTLAGALEMAERIRLAIDGIEVAADARSFGFTVSIGVTAFLPADRDWCEAVTRADHAMYRAKTLGRNRVESVAGRQPVNPQTRRNLG
jgi:diguanylate cyclase (GGDEF)-like protein/PAS domain S-box-containing protein